jgi:putative oxidoreductase
MANGANAQHTTARILSIILALVFLAAGAFKLMNTEQAAASFMHFGYPAAFAYVIALAEVGGGLLLFAPAMSLYAAGLLLVVMIGALFSHLKVGETSNALVPLVLAVLLGVVIVFSRRRST